MIPRDGHISEIFFAITVDGAPRGIEETGSWICQGRLTSCRDGFVRTHDIEYE
jgi:hypothetical protein